MGKNNKKRKHTENSSRLKDDDDTHEAEDRGNSKRSKKSDNSTKSENNYPILSHPELHKIQSSITVLDLQNLVLHCLADGKISRWATVKNVQQVKKAVVLFVPGLEKGMFDGSIALNEDEIEENCLEQPGESYGEDSKFQATSTPLVASKVATNEIEIKKPPISPDDFMPVRMVVDNLPTPLKPLAAMFTYQWPVKATGDDRFSKIHSPVQTLLTTPITKSEEIKRQNDEMLTSSKSAKTGSTQTYKRTSITAFIASVEELKENDYTIHPVYLNTPEMKEQEATRRKNATEAGDGETEARWIDSAVINLEEGEVPEKEVEAGSVTAGRRVLAIDCEMCRVTGGELALTRISVVNWEGEILMDELVKPYKKIIDYLTQYDHSLFISLHIMLKIDFQIFWHDVCEA